MTHVCPYCLGPTEYLITASKDDHVVRIYQCKVCQRKHEQMFYRYTPQNCPKHQWEFSHRVFKDDSISHSIEMVFICDRCGTDRIERQDTKAAGLSGRVEIDHPLVAPTLQLNKSMAKRFLDLGDELEKFWGNA